MPPHLIKRLMLLEKRDLRRRGRDNEKGGGFIEKYDL
jgi:hypothetical protein